MKNSTERPKPSDPMPEVYKDMLTESTEKPLPKVSIEDLEKLSKLSYVDLATEIIFNFCSENLSKNELTNIISEAYKDFEEKEVVTIKKVGNIDLLYTEGIERIKKYIFNSGEVLTPIVKPKLGDSAGVFGAALLFH